MKNFIIKTILHCLFISTLSSSLVGCSKKQYTPWTHENELYNVGESKAKASLKCDPFETCSIWDQNILNNDHQLKNIIKKFIANNYAQKVHFLNLANKSKVEIQQFLLKEGFKKEEPVDIYKDSGIIFTHADGSGVRIKDFDTDRKFRPQAHIVKFALRDSKKLASWENEAFKISNEGTILPKAPQSIYGIKLSPMQSSGVIEDNGWVDYIMGQAHINIVN